MTNSKVDSAAEQIKILVDNNRCVTCDLLNGPFVRYPCGHPVCRTCTITAEYCLLCLSPLSLSTNLIDVAYSRRIKHVSRLLTTFQDFFNIDVYKRHRLSNQLKLEKQLFPKCIQAPSKYCNKRKSMKCLKDKENSGLLFMADENFSKLSKMENTFTYVQQWLKKNESISKKSDIIIPRKPFADLNANAQCFDKDSLVTGINDNINSCRKRTHIKIIDTSIKTLKSKKKKYESFTLSPKQPGIKIVQKSKSENDESGIVIDEETIIIDSSQKDSYVVKDKLALFAVKEAEKLNSDDFTDFNETEEKSLFKNFSNTSDTDVIRYDCYKIPFYKRSQLYKFCADCKNENMDRNLKNCENTNNLSFVINDSRYITTIEFSQGLVKKIETLNKQSVSTQTDNCCRTGENNSCFENKLIITNNYNNCTKPHHEKIKSSDLFTDIDDCNPKSRSPVNSKFLNIAKCLVIEESDTESDSIEKENTLEVTAEVHKSETYDDCGVLSVLEPNEYKTRMKRNTVRGHTPLSTDSSDKENYDPNRIKKEQFGKKQCSKK